MAKNIKQNNGAPYQRRDGRFSHNSFKVRNNGYILEGSGTNPIKSIKRMADFALLNYGAMKQIDLNAELGRRIGNRLLDSLFGEAVKSAFSSESGTNTVPVEDNPELVRPMSFAQMLSRPMSHEEGVIAEGYILKGQITFCVAGADSGKTIFAIDTGIAAASGTVPTYLPPSSRPSEKMNVIFYRLEDRPGEMPKRYGVGNVFNDIPFFWVMRGDLQAPTQEGLIEDIKRQCEKITKDTLFIVDPLTKLPGFDAAKFIKEAEDLQTMYAKKGIILTFFCTAHTEEEKPWKSLTSDQILGGDKLLQQAASVFSIRQERGGKCYRFLQVLKPPKGEVNKDTVSVIKFAGRDENDTASYTHFVYGEEKTLQQALPTKPKPEDDERIVTVETDGRQEPRPWIDDDTQRLRELAETLETPYADVIAEIMGRNPVHLARKAKELGVVLMSKPRGRKPKPKEGDEQDQNQE